MAVPMTLKGLREYIRSMPEDEILLITFEAEEKGEKRHRGDESTGKTEAV